MGRMCVKLGLNANILTSMSIGFSVASAVAIAYHHFYQGFLWAAVCGICDMADGAVARVSGAENPFGAVLDRVSDRYAEFIIATGILLSGRVHPAWVMFTIVGMILASYSRSVAESVGGMKNCAVGWMERQEKALIVGVGLLLEPTLNPAGLSPHSFFHFGSSEPSAVYAMQIFVAITGILSHITVVQRLSFAKKHGKEAEE